MIVSAKIDEKELKQIIKDLDRLFPSSDTKLRTTLRSALRKSATPLRSELRTNIKTDIKPTRAGATEKKTGQLETPLHSHSDAGLPCWTAEAFDRITAAPFSCTAALSIFMLFLTSWDAYWRLEPFCWTATNTTFSLFFISSEAYWRLLPFC